MNSFAEKQAEDRRLSILLLLDQASGGSGNEALLHDALPTTFGHEPSIDQVRTDIAWLAEQQLVTQREVGGLVLASITPRGHDVATGRARVPGVKRPIR